MSGRHRDWIDPLAILALIGLVVGCLVIAVTSSGGNRPPITPPANAVGAVVQPVDPSGPPIGAAPAKDGRSPSRNGLPQPRRVQQLTLDGTRQRCVTTPAQHLRVVSFNIHSGWNHDRTRLMLDEIATEMAAMRADVFLLQEVDQNRVWNGRVDEPGVLAARLGMQYSFATNVLRAGDSRYGTAILSRYPITSSRNTLLPRRPGTQQRGLLHAVIAPAGRPLSLYVTHLEHTSSDMRLEQARAMAPILAADPNPLILGGDMNARPLSPPMTTLASVVQDSWTQVGSGPGLTHPALVPRSRIDYLLHRGDIAPLDSAVVRSAVSDHRIVVTDFDLSPSSADQVCVPILR